METYAEPYPGAKDKVKTVLQIMLTAWIGVQTIRRAEQMLGELKEE